MNKKTYPYHLTAAEESVLDILWNSKDPLTGQQIIEEAKKDESNSWQERSIFLFLNSLMDKKFIESVGFVRAGKTYARTFQPVLSRVLRPAGERCSDRQGTCRFQACS